MTLLTEWLYIAAQMPHGTHAQQNVFRAAQRAGRFGSAMGAPVRGAERLAAELRDRGVGAGDEVAAERGALRRGGPRRGGAPGARAAARRAAPVAAALSGADRDLAQRPLRGRARGLRAGRREPRLGRADATRSSSPTPTSRSPTSAASRGDRIRVLEHRLLDLRAGPRLAPGLRPLPALRLAGDRGR